MFGLTGRGAVWKDSAAGRARAAGKSEHLNRLMDVFSGLLDVCGGLMDHSNDSLDHSGASPVYFRAAPEHSRTVR